MPREDQLSLTELDPDAVHGHDRVIAGDAGYHGRCLCGYIGHSRPTKALARGTVTAHLARTEPGRRVVSLLRHH